jgi:methionyl-tRNA formyltransferase
MVGKKTIVGCSDGSLELITVQPSGKNAMFASDWFRGLRVEEVRVS